MSFSEQVKKEICQRQLEATCCINAASYGIACFGRYFDYKGVVLHTEREFVAEWAKQIYELAGIAGKAFAKKRENSRIYEFSVKDEFEVEKLLMAFGHTGNETAVRINEQNLMCEGCFHAFLASAFVCCGTVVNPEKAYNLEFVNPRYKMMTDFESLLFEKGFAPGRVVRKGANVVYIKSSEQIEDILTAMGAWNASMQLMDLKIVKDVRNKANRITNCETANIDKTIAANMQVVEAISVLRRNDAIKSLPQVLITAIEQRENNPELSLAQLVEIYPEQVSKSGLSHRYKKICEMAKKLEDGA